MSVQYRIAVRAVQEILLGRLDMDVNGLSNLAYQNLLDRGFSDRAAYSLSVSKEDPYSLINYFKKNTYKNQAISEWYEYCIKIDSDDEKERERMK